ncbi:hypothetical protein [Nocardia cyriacigeorgica]|uniref:hypothetical protein n=1 Tax=Nocardia cyriacigeorgica TaxID=135487 RepID=UPI000CE9BD45|nr:hypothetical protein [Nocardia cyriacigeorgica]AVH21440.1 hypothetical protein C5B73_08140 [Nocardia cyriacigeorgica]MBF6324346.1 hypothetical protein [Nocardia cyriacigeorgica]MBF6499749.1 hypothetical protein [Nocardia cyriacigeorgica]PPJ12304.1 hypothetical protein C5E43_10445 [Nocardia cyriacigeorgica]
MYYLDVLTSATTLDHSTWASQDIWASAIDLEAARSRKGSKKGKGGLIIGLICVVAILAIVVAVVLLMKRKKNAQPQQDQIPPQGQFPQDPNNPYPPQGGQYPPQQQFPQQGQNPYPPQGGQYPPQNH